ncbi:MAG: MaoC/PaaZ C-terminal domain-containing protein [Alphaproteobacteria bacterium]
MPLNYAKVSNWRFPEVVERRERTDTILYALGVGVGDDPMDAGQLRYVYEQGLVALPTLSTMMGYPGFWLQNPDTGIDWVQTLHAEMGFTIHQPLPVAGEIVGRNRVVSVWDKGDKGAIINVERTLAEKHSGKPIATLLHVTFARGAGNFGGERGPSVAAVKMPERAPDLTCTLKTLPQAALIYRLCGDMNPLHADPKIAQQAGFDRPILHGLCTYGVVGHAILRAACGYDATRFKAMHARFTTPVYPGETLETEMWRDGQTLLFRTRVKERGVIAVDSGRATVTG